MIVSGGGKWTVVEAAVLCSLVSGGIGIFLAYGWLQARFDWAPERQAAATEMVVCVRARSREKEDAALRILKEYGVEAVRVHEYEIDKVLGNLPLRAVRPDVPLRNGGDKPGRSIERSAVPAHYLSPSRNVRTT